MPMKRILITLCLLCGVALAQTAPQIYRPRSVEELNGFVQRHSQKMWLVGDAPIGKALEQWLVEAVRKKTISIRVLASEKQRSRYSAFVNIGAEIKFIPNSMTKGFVLFGRYMVATDDKGTIIVDSDQLTATVEKQLEPIWKIAKP
jgi:hypothetical protein